MATRTSLPLGPAKGERPASISYSITPSDQMSVRASTCWPRACSGDMYAAVPTTVPASVLTPIWVVSAPPPTTGASLARPKSSTLTTPSGRSMTFSGLMSR
jgi:hypothetical protein